MSRLSSDAEDLHEALIDLYLSVKIRSNDEVKTTSILRSRSINTMKVFSLKKERSYKK